MSEPLSTALRELASGQPDQPGDRVAPARSRARRIRHVRAAVAVAAAVAVLVPAGAFALSTRHVSTTLPATSGPLGWPDRSPAGDRRPAGGALSAWQEDNRQHLVSDVRWLWRGTLKTPDGNDLYAAVWTAERDGKPVVVASTTRRDEVDARGADLHPSPGSSPWVAKEQSPSYDHVGLYVEYSVPDVDPTNAIADNRDELFVLGEPAARDLTWQLHPLAGAVVAQGVAGSLQSENGVFYGDAGSLTGPVSIDLGRQPDLGGTLSDPSLASPRRAPVPTGLEAVEAGTGQSERQLDGSWSLASFADTTARGGVVAADLICYGGGRIDVTLGGFQSDDTLARGAVPCDGAVHEAFRTRVDGTGREVSLSSDRLQAYSLQVGSSSGP